MKFKVIPDYKFMTAIRNKDVTFSGANECRQAFEKCVGLSMQTNSKVIVLASHITQKLGFVSEQGKALAPICEFDSTTQGLAQYNHHNCIIETANTWLCAGHHVVILTEGSTSGLSFPRHPKLIKMNPRTFVNNCHMIELLQRRNPDAPLSMVILFGFFPHLFNLK